MTDDLIEETPDVTDTKADDAVEDAGPVPEDDPSQPNEPVTEGDQ